MKVGDVCIVLSGAKTGPTPATGWEGDRVKLLQWDESVAMWYVESLEHRSKVSGGLKSWLNWESLSVWTGLDEILERA